MSSVATKLGGAITANNLLGACVEMLANGAGPQTVTKEVVNKLTLDVIFMFGNGFADG